MLIAFTASLLLATIANISESFIIQRNGEKKITPYTYVRHNYQREMREIDEEMKLKAAEKACNIYDKFAPCACQEEMTNAQVHTGGKIVTLEYPEFKCNVKVNEKRKAEGKITAGYQCQQLKSKMTLYRDVYQNPIEIDIRYSAGC